MQNLTFVDPGTHRKIDDNRADDNAWWTLRPDECEGEIREVERVVWVRPDKNREENGACCPNSGTSNQDPNSFDNPGRWLRRILRQKGEARDNGETEDSDGADG